MYYKNFKNDLVGFSRNDIAEKSFNYDMHCHLFYEIYYFISGDVDYAVEGKIYHPKPYSILLLKPGAAHGVKVNREDYKRYAFHFMPDIIPLEHRDILLSPFFEDNICYENVDLVKSFDAVLDIEDLNKNIRDIALSCRLENLLTEIFTLGEHKEAEEPKPRSVENIVSYLNEHLLENISLDELSSVFFISKSQLNRIFRKSMNTTVGNYISLKRVHLARQLMLEGLSAEEAAIETGYKDYSTFYRTYKKIMGYSPTQTKDHTIFGK